MVKIDTRFTFLCFFVSVFLALVTSEYNPQSRSKYVQSTDLKETDIHFLETNKCKFFIVEKTIFYSCPKRPTRYPSMPNKVLDDGNDDGQDDNDDVHYSESEKFECPFPFGTRPHPVHCNKYYLCLFKEPRTMTCDSDKLYDEGKGECQKKSTVDCGDRTGQTKSTTQTTRRYTTETAEITTKKDKPKEFKCPWKFGRYPHPTDCKKFYVCIFDKPSTMTCDSDKFYDEYEEKCAEESTVDCEDRTKETKGTTQTGSYTTEAVKTTTKKEHQKFKCPYTWGTFPNPDDCSEYYLCLSKRPQVKKCKPSKLYDTKKKECKDHDEVDCGSRFNPREETTKPPTTTVASTLSPTSTNATTAKEVITSATQEEPMSSSPSGGTSDDGAKESSTAGDVSTQSESRTTLTEEVEGTTGEVTVSEETVQSTEEPIITETDTSETGATEPTSEKYTIWDNGTSDTDEPQVTSEGGSEETADASQPTAEGSSISQEPDITGEEISTSRNLETTNEDSDSSSASGTTIEEEISPKEPQFTPDFSTTPEDDVITASTESSSTGETEVSSEESQTPVEETSPEGISSGDFTNSDKENPTDGDGQSTSSIDLTSTTEKANEETSSLPENTADDGASSEDPLSTAEDKIPSGKQQSISDYSTTSVESDNTDEDSKTSSRPATTAEDRTSSQVSQSTSNDDSSSEKTDDAVSKTSSDQVTFSEEPITDEDQQKDQSTSTDYNKEISTNAASETTPAASSKPPELFRCPRKNGNFPHKDCSLYYACRGGVFTIESCQKGTLFRSNYAVCFNEDDVDCGERKRPDKEERSTASPVPSVSPRDRVTTEATSDMTDNSSEQSSSFDNTEKTVDYTSVETTSTLDYDTEETDSASDSSSGDLTSAASTADFGTSKNPEIDSTVRTENLTDYESSEAPTQDETVKTSETGSTFSFATKETSDLGDATTVNDFTEETKTDQEIVETSTDYNTRDVKTESVVSFDTEETEDPLYPYTGEKTGTEGTPNTEATSETYTTTDYSTEETSDATYSKQDEVSTESTVADNDGTTSQQWSTREATEEETKESFSSSQTPASTDSQEETTTGHTTGTSSARSTTDSNTEDESGTHSTVNIDETSSAVTFTEDNNISSETTVNHNTDEPSTEHTIDGDDESTSDGISTAETTTGPSLIPETTQSYPDQTDISESTQTDLDKPSKTTEGLFPVSSETVTSTTRVLDTTSSTEETAVSSEKPKETCPTGDNTCLLDDNGNVFRCPKPFGHFPHPTDSSKFIHCDNKWIHVMACPTGLRFNPEHDVCTWATA